MATNDKREWWYCDWCKMLSKKLSENGYCQKCFEAKLQQLVPASERDEWRTQALQLAEALKNWTDWEAEQVKKYGRYCGKEINTLIDGGNSTLASFQEWMKGRV